MSVQKQQNPCQMAVNQTQKKIDAGQVIARGLDIMAEVSLGRGVLVRGVPCRDNGDQNRCRTCVAAVAYN